ncbi:hypothetical protein HUA76_01475 [Myxococcus sp. CA056]|uniref:hypothetical protein n=1 Tax=Myxococcus sp. CA056 TaxID=2741740 RepID=UPI00157A38EF|nr:hypothetical protein [Myxococcus sp. CA056]NTX09439.1 hypothetical protein [Myxococcus sp. CA056]
MESTFVPWLALLGTVLFVVVVLTLAARDKRRQRKAWLVFATRRGWSFTQSKDFMEVQGLHQDRQLSLLTEVRGQNQGSYHVMVLRLDVSDVVPQELHLETEGLGDKFLKLFSVRDEELGDVALDSALNLKGLSPESHALLTTPQVGEHLLRAHRHYQRFSIVAGLLEAEHRGVPASTSALETHIAPALALADTLIQAARRAPVLKARSRQA